MEKKDSDYLRVRSSREFKLKDKNRRNFVSVLFNEDFGFKPDSIIIEKVRGKTNTFVLMCVLTPEEAAKEDKQRAEGREKQEKAEKAIKAVKKQMKDKAGVPAVATP